MGLFGGIGKLIHKATDFVHKAVDFIKKPFDLVQSLASKLVGKLANMLPFGLGKIVGPLLQKLVPLGLSFLTGGGAGVLGGLFQAANTVDKFANIADQAANFLQGLDGGGKDQALGNLQELATKAFADNVLGGLF